MGGGGEKSYLELESEVAGGDSLGGQVDQLGNLSDFHRSVSCRAYRAANVN